VGISAARKGINCPWPSKLANGSKLIRLASPSLKPVERWGLRIVGACQASILSVSKLFWLWTGELEGEVGREREQLVNNRDKIPKLRANRDKYPLEGKKLIFMSKCQFLNPLYIECFVKF
jgi:hypothetical protein